MTKKANMPKVLVGAPVSAMHAYCTKEFIKAIKSFEYPNYGILLVDNSKTESFYNKIKDIVPTVRIDYELRARERVTKAHNLLRDKALKGKYDYLLLLDQDVIPPPRAIEILIKREKKAISGLYFGHHYFQEINSSQVMPFAWKFIEKEGDWSKTRYLKDTEVWQPGLIKIAFAGGGCILLHRDVFSKLKFRYDPSIDAWDDRWLGYDLYANGFEFYLDNTIKCQHLYIKRPFSWETIKKLGLN